MSVFLQPIYTQTVGSTPVSSVTFNNIPQGYTDLYIEISARTSFTSNSWDDIFARFNGSDTGYSNTTLFCVGTSIVPARTAGQAYSWFGWAANTMAAANTFGFSTVYLPNYSGGSFKQYFMTTGTENNVATLPMGMQSVQWQNNAPITSITFTSANGANFLQYSTFTIYAVSNIFDVAAPTAPTIGTTTDLAGVISVAFTANDSGIADNYSITSSPATSTFYGNGTPIAVTSPTLAQNYTFTATANNSKGSGTSNASSSIATHNNFASIASYSGNNTTGTVTFTNIPQYYKNLQLRTYTANGTAVYTYIQLNGDTGSNYNYHQVYADGSSVTTGNSTGISFMYAAQMSGNASYPAANILDILEYTSTSKYKVMRSLAGVDTNGGGFVYVRSSVWQNYSPITSLTVTLSAGNITTGSIISLYGMG